MKKLLTFTFTLVSCAAFANPSNTKWKTIPSTYQVFAHGSVNGITNFQADALPKVRAGFAHWTSAETTCTSWTITYGGTFTSPTGKATINANDKKNYVVWLGGADWAHDSQTLGLTTTTYYQASGEIFDADMEMNNNRVWSIGGGGSRLDVESLATHEAGHYLGLDHSPGTAAVMYALYTPGAVKATLQTQDINDVCSVYPKATSGGTGTQGTFCSSDANCGTAAPKCRGTTNTGTSKICTIDCAGSQACPTGYTCQNDSSGSKSCLRPVGSTDLCKFCTSGAQCSTGICVSDGRHNWCTSTCPDAASGATSCGSGYTCVPLEGTGSYVCQPSTVCPTAQCTSAAQCPVGFGCVSGMCEATGKVGDRCEISTYCGACSDCIGTTTEAYCRGCCGGTGGGDKCTACTNAACGSGLTCEPVSNTNDKVCVPSQGAASCQACSAQQPCQTGLTCSKGRCLAPCNLNQPGSCAACFDNGGTGLCACQDMVAYKGQACGDVSGTYYACVTGTTCLGSPATCMAPCSTNTDCGSGETCGTMSGKSVCVPSNVPGAKCNACTANNTCDNGLVCFKGRCYTPCDVNNLTCGGCVDVEAATDVCACDDQRNAPGEGCGEAGNEIYACAPGSRCIANTCRLECVQGGLCPPGEECRALGDHFVCASADVVIPDAGGPNNRPDGGSAKPNGTQGCGCASSGDVGAFGLFAFSLFFARSRRRSPANA